MSENIMNPQSPVRSACDNCHKRKIRCILPQNGGPCHNCHSRVLPCYFLPRNRSGRPRILDHPSPSLPEADRRTATPLSSTSAGSDFSCSGSGPEQALASLPATISRTSSVNDPGSSSDDLFDWISPQEFPAQTGLHGFSETLDFPNLMEAGLLDSEQSDLPKFANPGARLTIATQQPVASSHAKLLPLPEIPSPVWRSKSRSPSQKAVLKEAAFAALLEQCVKLQRHLVALEEGDATSMSDEDAPSALNKHELSEDRMHEVLGDIDDSCKLMLEWCNEETPSTTNLTSQPSTGSKRDVDSALASLVRVFIFKVLQMCNILLSGEGLRVRSMKDVLFQKRLDFNITQARIITMHIENSTQGMMMASGELSAKAVEVEKRFNGQRR